MRRSIQNFALAVLMLGSGMAFAQEEPLDQRDRGMQQFRLPDQRGIGDFEALEDDQPFEGVKVRVGGAFAAQFQSLDHSNASTDTIPLVELGNNFNLPTANLDLDIALADGVRAHVRTYLSSRHHPESWVKGGYFQISSLDFIQEDFLAGLMDITTVKIGLMENNYGDYHFRRSDNASAIYNPFVGNLILDAFTTEMGAEVYFTPGDFLIMAGVTNGNLNQSVLADDRTPAFLGKLGYDTEVNNDLRVRLTGSIYASGDGQTNYLYFADRAGSRYYMVLAPSQFTSRSGQLTNANPTDQYTTGRFNPSFINQVTAIMINPYVRFKGFEFFGTYETSNGKIGAEENTRNWTQLHGELLYRFGADDNIYVGGKYNTASGELPNFGPGDPAEVSIDRVSFAAGWYMTKNVLLKAEYVMQNYNDFAESSEYHEGEFNGAVVEAVLSF